METIVNNNEIQDEVQAPITIRNFRSSPDVENFYRFIYENNLRDEAAVLLKTVLNFTRKDLKRPGRKPKKLLH